MNTKFILIQLSKSVCDQRKNKIIYLIAKEIETLRSYCILFTHENYLVIEPLLSSTNTFSEVKTIVNLINDCLDDSSTTKISIVKNDGLSIVLPDLKAEFSFRDTKFDYIRLYRGKIEISQKIIQLLFETSERITMIGWEKDDLKAMLVTKSISDFILE